MCASYVYVIFFFKSNKMNAILFKEREKERKKKSKREGQSGGPIGKKRKKKKKFSLLSMGPTKFNLVIKRSLNNVT